MHTFERQKATSKATISTDDRLPGWPRPKFIYAHSPMSWEWSVEHERFLPRLKRINIMPGTSGIRKGAGGHAPMIANLQSQGWTVLPDDMQVIYTDEGGKLAKDTHYMVAYQGRRGTTYADVWERPVVIGGGASASVDWSSLYDVDGFNAWRASLLDSGAVPPPNPAVLAGLVQRQERRAGRRINDAHDGAPHVQRIVEGHQQTLSDMQEAAVKAGGKRKRRPVSRKRAKKAEVDGN